jgi:hypothetical protein
MEYFLFYFYGITKDLTYIEYRNLFLSAPENLIWFTSEKWG